MVPITFGGGGAGIDGGEGERVQGQGTIQRFLIALLEPLAEPLEDVGEPAARRPVSAGPPGSGLGGAGRGVAVGRKRDAAGDSTWYGCGCGDSLSSP